MLKLLGALRLCRRGATAIEYGLVASLVVIALIGGLSALGNSNRGGWGNVSARVGAVEP